MKDAIFLIFHLLSLLAKLLRPGGSRAIIAENLLLKRAIGSPGPSAVRPKPRVNLTRYHGVLAPNHRWRGLVTPAKRGKGVKRISNTEIRSPAERHASMTWAQRLKRVFNIDIEVCSRWRVVTAVDRSGSSPMRRTGALRTKTS